ncbi:hypothetical protein SJA_C2-04830 [Sphingobium indicum UT26S]|uniref:Uncharacterized protein n=1 Tax=Sphingobium indicum (strain DSM 16413 / CCM 7287 / MTCC 6362 / UT26 / NBRC 101211 / UT26S) TaxID=452662 RepID=D4Z6Y8_SPHIU|nr:hypothetical protein SJA_C2-04830 [Sphingobium indicum UT26S]
MPRRAPPEGEPCGRRAKDGAGREKEKHYKIHMLAGIFFMSGPARSGRCDSPAEQGAGGSRTGMGGPGPLCVCPISPFIGRLGSWRSAGSRQRSSAPDIRQF